MPRQRVHPPWRSPIPEPGPITLVNRRLYILPTRIGLFFIALIGGVLLTASNYSVSLGYLFGFLLGGMGLVGLLHTQRNLLGLVLTPLPVTPVFAGEAAIFRLRVGNPDRRPRSALKLVHVGKAGAEADLPGSGQAELEIRLVQNRRGFHKAGAFTLASDWPLGLYRCWTLFAFDWGALVYPRPAATALPLPLAGQSGQGRDAIRSGDDEYAGLRGYHPGDAPSRIAWKSLARGHAPSTKQFAEPVATALRIEWDAAPEKEIEARIARLTRWLLDAERSGQAWAFEMPGLSLPPGRGDAHLKQALERLARYGET